MTITPTCIRVLATAATIGLFGAASAPAFSDDSLAIHMDNQKVNSALSTYWNIQKHLSVVPKFFQLFPESGLPAIWHEYRDVELSPTTALDAKTKELIALAVAAEIPCAACLYFHSAAATANGATGKEISEAVALAFMGRAWSAVLTADHVDMVRKDTNILLSIDTLKVPPK